MRKKSVKKRGNSSSSSKKRKKIVKTAHHKRKNEGILEKIEQDLKEEEKHILEKHKGKYQIPIGIRLLIGYMLFLGFVYTISFFSNITSPTAVIVGTVLNGLFAITVNSIVLITLLFTVIGFYKRKAYAFDLGLVWFSLGFVNSLFSFILFDSSRYAVFGDLMFISFLSMTIIDTLVIWYLLSEKKYFHAKIFREAPWQSKDKVFVYVIVTFWVLVILIGLSYVMNFYNNTTTIVDKTLIELGNTKGFFPEDVCLRKEGKERDVCFTVLATMYETSDAKKIGILCSNVESDFMRFTCLRALK